MSAESVRLSGDICERKGFLIVDPLEFGRANGRLILTDSDTGARAEVKLVLRLYVPAGLIQHRIDRVARHLFWSAVNFSHCKVPVSKPRPFLSSDICYPVEHVIYENPQ